LTPASTATSEINRPTPENKATEINWTLSEFVDDDVLETDGEMRAAFGMAALQFASSKKIPALEGGLGSYDEGSMILRISRKYVHQTSQPASATNDVRLHLKALTGLWFLRWRDYPR
jgi:hypothetical protein